MRGLDLVDFRDKNLYQYVPEFHDGDWCWLEVYKKESGETEKTSDSNFVIYPQFYSTNGEKKYRSSGLINKENLVMMQFAHSSGKIVKFETNCENKDFEFVYLYRNIQSFDSYSGQSNGGRERFAVQAFLREGNCWQVKLMNNGDVVFTDNHL